MDTRKRNTEIPSKETARADNYFLCQVFPLYDDTGYPVVQTAIGESLLVGREADLDGRLRIFDQLVSRDHCRFFRTLEGLFLEDLNSTNGTLLNGVSVVRAEVRHQDVVRIGDALFVVVAERPAAEPPLPGEPVVACSRSMVLAVERLRRVAGGKRNVMLVGPTGTGKDLLAGLLHRLSGRTGPLVNVNCANMQEALVETSMFGCLPGAFTGAKASRGLVARAHRGTLFLDELGEMSLALQSKLLRFLETGEVLPVGEVKPQEYDVRVVAATQRVEVMAGEDGGLRSDLLARLEDEVIRLRGLGQRREEIVAIMAAVIAAAGEKAKNVLSADCAERALCALWDRNVRQLVKATERALLSREPGTLLPTDEFAPSELGEGEMENRPTGAVIDGAPSAAEVTRTLMAVEGDIEAAALKLQCERRELYRWIERYALTVPALQGSRK